MSVCDREGESLRQRGLGFWVWKARVWGSEGKSLRQRGKGLEYGRQEFEVERARVWGREGKGLGYGRWEIQVEKARFSHREGDKLLVQIAMGWAGEKGRWRQWEYWVEVQDDKTMRWSCSATIIYSLVYYVHGSDVCTYTIHSCTVAHAKVTIHVCSIVLKGHSCMLNCVKGTFWLHQMFILHILN